MATRQQVGLQIPFARLQPQASPQDSFVNQHTNLPRATPLDFAPFSKALAGFFSDLGDRKFELAKEEGRKAADSSAQVMDAAEGYLAREVGDATGEEAARRRNRGMMKLVKEGVLPGPMATPGGQIGWNERVASRVADGLQDSLLSQDNINALAAPTTENGDITQPPDARAVVDQAFAGLSETHPGLAGSFFGAKILRERRDRVAEELSRRVASKRSELALIQKRTAERVMFQNGDDAVGLKGFTDIVSMEAGDLQDPTITQGISDAIETIALQGDPEAVPNFADAAVSYGTALAVDDPRGAHKFFQVLLRTGDDAIKYQGRALADDPEILSLFTRAQEKVDDLADKRSSRWQAERNQRLDTVSRDIRSIVREMHKAGASEEEIQAKVGEILADPSSEKVVLEAYGEDIPEDEARVFRQAAEDEYDLRSSTPKAYNAEFDDVIYKAVRDGQDPFAVVAQAEQDGAIGYPQGDQYRERFGGIRGTLMTEVRRSQPFQGLEKQVNVALAEFAESAGLEETSKMQGQFDNAFSAIIASASTLPVTSEQEIPGALQNFADTPGFSKHIDNLLAKAASAANDRQAEIRGINELINSGQFSEAAKALGSTRMSAKAVGALEERLGEARRDADESRFDYKQEASILSVQLEEAYATGPDQAAQANATNAAHEAITKLGGEIDKRMSTFEGTRVDKRREEERLFRELSPALLEKAGKDVGIEVDLRKYKHGVSVLDNQRVYAPDSKTTSGSVFQAYLQDQGQIIERLPADLLTVQDRLVDGSLSEGEAHQRVGIEALAAADAAFATSLASVGYGGLGLSVDEILNGQVRSSANLTKRTVEEIGKALDLGLSPKDAVYSALGQTDRKKYGSDKNVYVEDTELSKRVSLALRTAGFDVEYPFEGASSEMIRNQTIRIAKDIKIDRKLLHPSLTPVTGFERASVEDQNKMLELLGYDTSDLGTARASFLLSQKRIEEAQ